MVIVRPWNLADEAAEFARELPGSLFTAPLKEAQAPSTATPLEGSSRSIVDQRGQKDLH